MRVAICTYWYPPARTIASLRMVKFGKFLPEFGWEPIVFTIAPVTNRYTSAGALDDELPPAQVHRVPDPSVHVWVDRLGARLRGTASAARPAAEGRERSGSLASMAYRVYRDAVCVPDETWPWLAHFGAIRRIAADAGIDLVFSSSPPATAHLLAQRLAAALGKPWVADLRDPWAEMHTLPRTELRRRFDVWLERRTLRRASAITTVSGTMARRFAEQYRAPVHVIMNGYDPADVPADAAVEPDSERLSLVYTGMLYEGRRTPLMVFRALRALAARGRVDLSRVVVKLYGRNMAIAERELAGFPDLHSSVEIGGEVSYKEALLLQRAATVLLLLEWPDPRAVGVVTGKIFEYVAAERPIIAIAPHGGEIEEVLRTTGSGHVAQTQDELERVIADAYTRFLAHGPERLAPAEATLESFSRRAMSQRLASVFDQVVAGEGRP